MSEVDRQRRRARERERRRNYSEERRQAERVRARENRQNVNEEREKRKDSVLWKTDKILAKKAESGKTPCCGKQTKL